MAFRGYFALGGQEIANSSRVVDHLNPPLPVDDEAPSPFCDCSLKTPYDDSWTGLRAALGDDPYVIPNAPWYTPAHPQSAEFAGVWVMDVKGLDAVPVERTISEVICAGGAAGPPRDATKEITFSALIVACTNAGAEFGLKWLNCQLRAMAHRGTTELTYYQAHPEDTAAVAATLKRRLTGVVLTSSATVSELAGKGGGHRHRQANVYRVEFTLVALHPYAYADPVTVPVVWDTEGSEAISWVHAPDCSTPGACNTPILYNADCTPEVIPITAAPVPSCGGCLPVCDIERKVFELPTALTVCDETAVTTRITNNGPDNLTVNFYWQPCGSVDICDRVHPLQISGLPAGVTAVADSIGARPYVEVGGQRQRQVGIISTATGQPWQPMVIDRMDCWELVAETTDTADFDVELILSDRES